LDDFILFGFFFICFWANFSLRQQLSPIENTLFAIVGFSIFSCLINNLLYAADIFPVKASFLYSVRLLEYFLFFYIGVLASRFMQIHSIVKAFFVWNMVLMVLQKLQIIGIFSVEGYIPKSDDRMLGIASFGSEIGLLLNLLFCFLIYQDKEKAPRYFAISPEVKRALRTLYPYFLLLLFVFLVVLSGARMAIFAQFFSFLICLKDLIHWRKPVTFILPTLTLGIGIALMVFTLYNSSTIVTRSKGLLSFKNIDLISTVWDNVSLEHDPIGKESVRQGNHDASWWMRIHKWCYALKLFWLHPEAWLQGLGPGFAMAALDGGFLRILTELGLIGCLLYGRLFYLIGAQSPQLRWMMIAFLLNMVFFDVYLAYKPMSLLFLILGHTYATNLTFQERKLKLAFK
ncbi:MAG: hypothetical protein ACXU9U_05460, partial [Parachlamydiaceae bacterium]